METRELALAAVWAQSMRTGHFLQCTEHEAPLVSKVKEAGRGGVCLKCVVALERNSFLVVSTKSQLEQLEC